MLHEDEQEPRPVFEQELTSFKGLSTVGNGMRDGVASFYRDDVSVVS